MASSDIVVTPVAGKSDLKAFIDLPKRLTVDPEKDKVAYDKWRAEIDTLRAAAGMRLTKIKPLTPA